MRIYLVLTLALLAPVTARASQEHQGAPAKEQHGAPATARSGSPAKELAPRPAVPATTPKTRSTTVASVVQRLQDRVAEHYASRPAVVAQPRPALAPKAPRVRLVWRVSVAWPAELKDPATTTEPSAPPAPGRVKLGWMGPEP